VGRAPNSLNAAATDWAKIEGHYDALMLAGPSPVVELNRAATVAMRDGRAAELALIDAILAWQSRGLPLGAGRTCADRWSERRKPSYERVLSLTQ
jgi:RNA polymerase sigma-70 factor, ECF subfamily